LILAIAWLGSCGVHRAEGEALADPASADAWEALGDAYRRSLRREMAADAYRTALQLDPHREELVRRVSAYPSQRARELQRAAMRAPGDDELWGDLGDTLQADGDLGGARGAFLRAFRLDPEDGEWQRALAVLGDGEMVAQVLLARLDPSSDESLGDYGDVLDNLGHQEEACTYWRRAAEIDPADDEWIGHAAACGYPVARHRGFAPADTGQIFIADTGSGSAGPPSDDLESLVARVSADVGLLVRLGQAYLRSGDVPKANETLWGALLVAPTDKEALQSYLAASGKTRRQVLEALRDAFPQDDEVLGLLGDHYLDLGLRQGARELYDKAHGLDPQDPEWAAKRSLLQGAR
jgi:tetratricopeptide (TPR) repeat protein